MYESKENFSNQESVNYNDCSSKQVSSNSFNSTLKRLSYEVSSELEQNASEIISEDQCSNASPKSNLKFSLKKDFNGKSKDDNSSNNINFNSTFLSDLNEKSHNEQEWLSNFSITMKPNLKQPSIDDEMETKGNNRNKKKSWYSHILSPTYKSRSDTFKKIFKTLPEDEQLLIDYSCAMQHDYTVHGRMYVSQNYFCFFANIIKWETLVTVSWKEVTSITKEKTTLLIPNAIVIQTVNDKFFFSSFSSRDKAYMLLFKIWQNSILNQALDINEVYQIVHDRYGKELGLTSDDEDLLLSLVPNKDKQSKHLSLDLESEGHIKVKGSITSKIPEESSAPQMFPLKPLPIDGSDVLNSSKSETYSPAEHRGSPNSDQRFAVCSEPHNGRLLIKVSLPVHVDQLFTLLFTTSKFFLDFHTSRKTTDLSQTAWIQDEKTGIKSRKVSLTIFVNKTVGPKTSQVTETQKMLPCTTPGHLYSINVESTNAGIPYADSFNIFTHYCMMANSETESTLEVFAEVKYKKSVWGLVKSVIEKNCWSGMQEYLNNLIKALEVECEENGSIPQNFNVKSKKLIVTPKSTQLSNNKYSNDHSSIQKISPMQGITDLQGDKNIILSWILLAAVLCLIFINCLLYFKLQRIEDAATPAIMDLHILKNTPKTEEDWMNLLQQQESLHTVETKKWQRVLHTCIELLKQTQEALIQLQTSVHPTITEKMFSVIKPGLKNHQHNSDL